MRISKRHLRRIIREAEGSTKKYDTDSALKGKQSDLPDALQKGIIDKTVEDREEDEEEEKKDEGRRLTKRQLRRIIKEEKLKLLKEAPQDRIVQETDLLGDLNSIVSSIEEVEKGMYGLQDPGDPDQGAGDELAMDLNLQIERLNEFFRKLNTYFESMDPENKAQDYWENRKNQK